MDSSENWALKFVRWGLGLTLLGLAPREGAVRSGRTSPASMGAEAGQRG